MGIQVWFVAAGLVTILMAGAGFFIPALLNIEERGAPAVALEEAGISVGTAVTGPVG
jgi:hypothetical protein